MAGLIIALASWLSGKKPELAGFIIALPLTSIIVLAFSYAEHKNIETSITFAKSIAIGVPISYLFFIPFFLNKQLAYQLASFFCLVWQQHCQLHMRFFHYHPIAFHQT